MKKARIKITLTAVAVLVVAVVIWHYIPVSEPGAPTQSDSTVKKSDEHPVSAQSEQSTAGVKAQAAAETAKLVKQMREWRAITDNEASDRKEMELSSQITDANAADFVRGLPPELLQTPVGLRALERWSRLEQRTAVEWLATQKNPTPFQITTALHGWVGRNAEALHGFLDSLPEGAWKEKVLVEVSRDAVRYQQPLEAITLLRDLPPGDTQTSLAKAACTLWAQGDPASAAAWTDKVEDPALKRQLIGSVAAGAAYSDPQNAASWLLERLPAGEELNDAMGNVVQVWVEESKPEAAAAWAAQLPAGEVRHAAVKGLISEWRQRDPQAFANWMKDAQSATLRQDVTNQLANVDARGDLR